MYDEVISTFGTGILRDDGSIDRKAFVCIVFPDKKHFKIQCIIHKHLVDLTREKISAVLKDDSERIIVIDAAILIEGGFLPLVDKVLIVHASRDIRIQRLVADRKFSLDDAVQRINVQRRDEDWFVYADFIIDNSYSMEETKEQVTAIWEKMRS